MFLFIDRYKLGIVVAFGVYISFFVYLEMQTYRRYFPIPSYSDKQEFEVQPDELLITPEQVQIEQNYNSGDLKNISRDQNDTRERSNENWKENNATNNSSTNQQSIEDYEKSLFESSGGASKRETILKEMEQRKNDQKNDQKNPVAKNDDKNQNNGGKTAYAGNVMVDWSLAQRTAHLNNNWYVRNPGYTCGYGSSGKITVQIKVNQNGDVIQAVVLSSSGANACMTQQALKYAKLSRFNYSSTAATSQVGTITYTFVSQ